MTTALAFAIQLAQQAGQLLLNHHNRTASARLKSDRSIVTDADLAADRLIAGEIHANFPGELILSEELQPQLSGKPGGSMWVVDPLDGTTNFSLGLPYWGISIARLFNGKPAMGVLYFPQLDELYSVQAGGGAEYNGSTLVSEHPLVNQPVSFFSCCSRTYRKFDIKLRYKPRILGSAAYSLCSVARGIAVIAFEASPKIWDLAAAWLLVQEAGGIIESYDGIEPFPLREDVDYRQTSFPTLAAISTPQLAEARQKIIRK
jgi:myo-inositol-1(or 4)-monophosphatase